MNVQIVNDLAIHDLSIHAAGGPIVSNVSLSLGKGRPLTLLGESGSGKSLVAQAIIGDLPAGVHATGSVVFKGLDLLAESAAERRQRWGRSIGLLPQEPWLAPDPTMRVGPQVAEVHRYVKGTTAKDSLAATRQNLAEVSLSRAEALYPFQISGGMGQRAAIAMAHAADTEVLIADEPTKGLDAALRNAVAARLRHEVEAWRLLLTITHDVAVARALGGTIGVMLEGRLVEYGPAEKLLEKPEHAYTRALLAAEPSQWDRGRDGELSPLRFQKLYQDPPAAFASHQTIRKGLKDLARLHGKDWREIEVLSRRLRLQDVLLDRLPGQVSGGELQLSALLRALLPNPAFLFPDEATSRLDPVSQHDVIAFLQEIVEETGLAVLLVTHDRDLAERPPRGSSNWKALVVIPLEDIFGASSSGLDRSPASPLTGRDGSPTHEAEGNNREHGADDPHGTKTVAAPATVSGSPSILVAHGAMPLCDRHGKADGRRISASQETCRHISIHRHGRGSPEQESAMKNTSASRRRLTLPSPNLLNVRL